MTWRVMITARNFDLTPEPVKYLKDNGCELIYLDETGSIQQSDQLTGGLRGVDAVIAGTARLTREVIDKSDSLKIISRRGVGYDNVDLAAATKRQIVVTITQGTVEVPVADHVFALMLAVARGVVRGHNSLLDGEWQSHVGVEIWGKTLGIVGLGRIGKAVARRARGFEMRLLAYDIHEDAAFALENAVRYVSLDQLMQESDFISVNAALTDKTHHLIGERELQLTKPSAILVNTSRGGLVDEVALKESLRSSRLRGAGIDTFEIEPPTELPFSAMDNVVMTPHVGGYTEESLAQANYMAAENLVRLMRGEFPAGNVVNPEAWDNARWRRQQQHQNRE